VRLTVRLLALALLAGGAGCAPKLVASYDSGLQQRASTMQAEVAAWELAMRAGAGTIADDPRNPEVVATLNKWRGEIEAMLTLAAIDDPGAANCAPAAQAVSEAIKATLPADLQASVPALKPAGAAPTGCEAMLVANLSTLLDDTDKALTYCSAGWVPASYFAVLTENPAAAPRPPAPPSPAAQDALSRSCLAEFKVLTPVQNEALAMQHGRAVSRLLNALQAIVYVENRKKAAAAPQ
jgi:hypothetical protein